MNSEGKKKPEHFQLNPNWAQLQRVLFFLRIFFFFSIRLFTHCVFDPLAEAEVLC